MSSPCVWGAQNLKIELLGLPRLDCFMVFHGGCLISKLLMLVYKSWNSINLFNLVILNCWCFQNMLWLLRCLHHFARGMILVCFIPRRIAESPRGLKMRHLVRVVQELERQAECFFLHSNDRKKTSWIMRHDYEVIQGMNFEGCKGASRYVF